MKALILILMSFVAFAQKDTTITTKRVVVLDSVYYVQTTTTTVSHQLLNANLLKQVEDIEQEEARKIKENTEKRAERREIVRLVQQALRQGYKPKSDNSYDDAINSRILNKIKKEKL
jgi:predicted membrane-bound dolichyl-phosphate-mannose-protein mannosyltransferase